VKIKFDEKLVVERFPEQKDWIEPLFQFINDLAAQTTIALKGRLTFLDNMLGKEREFDFTYQSATVNLPQRFTWGLATPPKALNIVYATEDGVPIILLAAWQLTQSGLISLTEIWRVVDTRDDDDIDGVINIRELKVASRYFIRVRVTP
jgi:hypothetical protein